MAKNAPSLTRIYQFVFGLALVLLSFRTVQIMMRGSTKNARQVAAFVIAAAVVLWLDKLYWLVLPLSMALNLKIPGVPFDSKELGCVALFGMHFVRTCLHRDPAAPWNRHMMTAVPLFLWICVIWATNPVGMRILGSESMGGRFYLKILLSFLAMTSLSSIRIGEAECRLVFRTLVFGAFLSVALTLLHPSSFNLGADEFSETNSRYYLLVFLIPYYLLWARYSMKEVLSSIWLFGACGILSMALVVSGKRNATAAIGLYPFYRALLTRRHRMLTLGIAAVAFVFISIMVGLDGHYIRLPRSSHRTLALVFPKYRDRTMEGYQDSFRSIVHGYAKDIIREHPWVGRQGFKIDAETIYWMATSGRSFEGTFYGHAYTGNWHGAFYAYAADFGIPCLCFYLLFLFSMLHRVFLLCRRIQPGSFTERAFLFYALMIMHSAVIMFTSGHSSHTSETAMLTYGMILAIENGLKNDGETSLAQ